MVAIVKRLAPGKPAAAAKPAPGKPKPQLSLAKKAREPSSRLQDYSMLIYGRKGIGKTSLASKFPGAHFLALEPGTGGIKVLVNDVPDWDHFVGYVDLLCEEADPDRTVVVDVVDLAYDYIYQKVCDKLMIASPTEENDFGATWRKIRKEFRGQLERLCRLPGGKIFLSHDTEKEITLRDGNTVERVQPTMSKQALGEVEGIVDVVGCYDLDGDDRFLVLQPSQTLVAKCRLEEHFLVKGSEPGAAASRVKRIPMGDSSQEAYDNLVAAFDNEQADDGMPVKRAAAAAGPRRLAIKRK